MSQDTPKFPEYSQRAVLIVIALGVSTLFLWLIWDYLMALLLAAVFTGWCFPLYKRLAVRLGGRDLLAAGVTVFSVFLVVIIPLLGFLTLVGFQAVELAREARPWIDQWIAGDGTLDAFSNYHLEILEPYRQQIQEKVGSLLGSVGSLVVTGVTAAAQGMVQFFLALFVMLYAMFFFLTNGRALIERILFYLPLPSREEDQLVARFVSVTRATIKGTLMIGVLQGALAGVGFWVAGVKGVAVWATAMAVLSAIPPLGPMLIWGPAVVYLAAIGNWTAAVGLFAWCAVVVGSVDNVLRPRLVGRDTKLPDILVLTSTLGGLMAFGAPGVIVGPIIAALFVTVWALYGTAFAGILPPREGLPTQQEAMPPQEPKQAAILAGDEATAAPDIDGPVTPN